MVFQPFSPETTKLTFGSLNLGGKNSLLTFSSYGKDVISRASDGRKKLALEAGKSGEDEARDDLAAHPHQHKHSRA